MINSPKRLQNPLKVLCKLSGQPWVVERKIVKKTFPSFDSEGKHERNICTKIFERGTYDNNFF